MDDEQLPPQVISRQTALAEGLSDRAIQHRLGTRRWQRLYPGTYAPFSGPVPREVWFDAAVQYAGCDAALSHQTAAFLQGWRADSGIIHVTIDARRRVDPQKDLHIHRTRQWSPSEWEPTLIPRTTPERTVLDLVAAVDRAKVAGLVTDLIRSRLTTPEKVLAAAIMRTRQHHRGLLVAIVGEAAGGVDSVLELMFAQGLRLHGILEPRRQVREALPGGRSIRLDTLFDPYPVVAELDGRVGHSTAAEVAADQARDNAHVLAGRLPLRYGWVRVIGEMCGAAAEVADALTACGWPGSPRVCGPSCAVGSARSSTNREGYRRLA